MKYLYEKSPPKTINFNNFERVYFLLSCNAIYVDKIISTAIFIERDIAIQ